MEVGLLLGILVDAVWGTATLKSAAQDPLLPQPSLSQCCVVLCVMGHGRV